jgi:glycoprotein endo-alpha-1,2-mannosidase
MYDLSGLGEKQMDVVIKDWKMRIDRMKLGRDKADEAYLRHRGKPVVAVWGIGFKDGRKYTLDECARLIDLMKGDTKYGGFTVMVGVPTGWHTFTRDAVKDKKLHEVIGKADIISPWTIGRYSNLKSIERHAQQYWKPDIAWCKKRGKEYLPVVFPGFSWHNMKPEAPLNQIPRLKGKFLWKQYYQARQLGATMVYQAMFDEIDEATAIFKCTNQPPTGKSSFLHYEGLPSDHYLWLTGTAAKMIGRKIKPAEQMPQRPEVGIRSGSPEPGVKIAK